SPSGTRPRESFCGCLLQHHFTGFHSSGSGKESGRASKQHIPAVGLSSQAGCPKSQSNWALEPTLRLKSAASYLTPVHSTGKRTFLSLLITLDWASKQKLSKDWPMEFPS